MFINDQDHTIEDFLQAVNFVAPKGMSLKYFIVPYAANTEALMAGAGQYGFEPEPTIQANAQDVPGVTDTITYAKKDYTNRQSFNDSNFNLNQVPNEFPITRQGATSMEPMQTDLIAAGANIQSPIKGVKVLESMTGTSDILIKESFSILPKNTLLHFEKGKLNEDWREPSDSSLPAFEVGNTSFKATPLNQNFNYRYKYTDTDKGYVYSKILKFISEHPFCKKIDILKGCYTAYNSWSKVENWSPAERNGYWSGVLQTLHHDGFFRVTTKHEYVPTQKCRDFVKEHNL